MVVTLCHREVFHTPGFAAAWVIDRVTVAGDAPVGADDTLEMLTLAQLLLDEPFAITAAYVLARGILIEYDAVDGHHG